MSVTAREVSSTPVTPAEEIRLSREVFHLDTTGL